MNKVERELQRWLEITAMEIEDYAERRGMLDRQLRFGYNRLRPHAIGDAYFCEKKLDWEEKRKRGEIEEDIKRLPPREQIKVEEKEHDSRKRKDIGEDIDIGLGGKGQHIEWQEVKGIYKGFLISGEVDEIRALSSSEVTVVDRKSKYEPPRSGRPFHDALVQIRAYCYCVGYMHKFAKRPIPKIDYIVEYIPVDLEEDWCVPCGGRYFGEDVSYSLSELDFVIPYWTMEREAIPTRNPNKGKACKFFEICGACISKSVSIS